MVFESIPLSSPAACAFSTKMAHLRVRSSAWMLTLAPELAWQQPSSAAEGSLLPTGPEPVLCIQGVFSDRTQPRGQPSPVLSLCCCLTAVSLTPVSLLGSFPVPQKVSSWTQGISEQCSKRKVQSRPWEPLTSLSYV